MNRSCFVSPRLRSGSGYMVTGPSGWTRTTTARVKSPACSVDTTEGTFALVRPTGIEPVPPRWRRGMLLHTQAERGPVGSPARSPFPSVVKEPALASWWAARDSNPIAPRRGERGYGPSADHPHVPPVLATAPGIEPGPPSFGGSDASPAPRCRFASRPDLSSATKPPRDLARRPVASGPKQKRPSRGSP